MTELSHLTLVVPTYKRQKFAIRLMDYWADKGPDVILLDGSPEPIALDLLAKYPPSIRYFHKPVGLYERLSASLDLITTDFVALADDEDFYIPSAIQSCIDEMERHPDLVACCGRSIGFTYTGGSILGAPQYSVLENYTLDASSAEERLVKHMREYVPSLIYAVCRTNHWKTTFKHILRKEFPFYACGEIQFEMFMGYAGKSKVIPELMWLRSHETEPIRGTNVSLDPDKRIPSWWHNANNAFEHEEFISIMSEGFLDLLDAKKELNGRRTSVVKGVEAYLEYFCEEFGGQNPTGLLRGIFIRVIPDVCKQPIKNILRKFWLNQTDVGDEFMGDEMMVAAKSLEAMGAVYVDFDELSKIESVIKELHEKQLNQVSGEKA